jgi:hypothetical protein
MHSFFSPLNRPISVIKDPGVLSFDRQGELACAVLITDLFLSPVNQQHDLLAEKLLRNLFKHSPNCPRLQQDKSFLTPSKYLQALCLEQTKPQALRLFIETMAINIKHIIIEEILTHPLTYSALFIQHQHPLENLTPWMAHALANALHIGLTQFETQHNKRVAKQQMWLNGGLSSRYLLLHQHHHHWQLAVSVEHYSWFESLKNGPKLKSYVLSSELLDHYKQRSTTAFTKVQQHHTELSQQYSLQVTRWRKWVIKENCDTHDLINYYIHHLSAHSSIPLMDISIESDSLTDVLIHTLAWQTTYLPIQKLEKISPNKSSDVNSPVI